MKPVDALTRFTPGAQTNMPAHGEVDDSFFVPSLRRSMLGGDVFEDDKRVVPLRAPVLADK